MSNPQPGWYPDPYQPARLRYWDGEVWTEYYHEGNGELPSIGDWLNSTFSAIGQYGIPAFGLAVASGVVTTVAFYLVLLWSFDGTGVRSTGSFAEGTVDDVEFIGDLSAFALKVALAVVVFTLITLLTWLMLNRFMQRAHLQAEPTIAEALSHSLGRVPRALGWGLVVITLVAVIVAIFVVIASLLIATVPALGIIVFIFAGIPLMLALAVKTAFVFSSVAASPKGTNPLRASFAVSQGRFLPVLGRMLVLWILVWIVSAIIDAILQGAANPFDEAAIERALDGGSFMFADLLPSSGALILYLMLSSVVSAGSSLVTTSATMRLYLDAGGPSEL